MSEIFPTMITQLPQIETDLSGANLYLSQGKDHQIVFMEFTEDVRLPEHHHAAQWELVVHGRVDLKMEGKIHRFQKGDSFYIPEEVPHSGKIFKGYASIAFFDQKDRYKEK